MITHYAPDVSTYLNNVDASAQHVQQDAVLIPLSQVVVIDFCGQLANTKPIALAYRDMSTTGNVQEATKVLFECLRFAEKVQGAKAVLLANMQPFMQNKMEHADAIFDRMFRAASGRLATLTSTHLAVSKEKEQKE